MTHLLNIEAHEVYPKLWVGSVPKNSLRWHFDLVVLCAVEHQDVVPDVEALKAPFDDGPLNDVARKIALSAARKVARALKAGKRVLVTCHAGVNRSALVAALAMMYLGEPADVAIDAIRAKRRGLYGLTPFSNTFFRDWVVELGSRGVQR